MKFFDRWKKRSFEEKMDDLSQTVLTENNIKDPKQVEQYVVERLEQMIDITREIEEEKSEYRTVTSYLNDVQKLEDLPEPETVQSQGLPVFRSNKILRIRHR